MFSGRTVILKKSVDRATAAQYQAVFRKAGARLRVVPVRAEVSTPPAVAPLRSEAAGRVSLAERLAAEHGAAAPPPSNPAVGTAAAQVTVEVPEYQLAPPGADVLTEDERRRVEVPDIDVSALTVAEPGERLAEEAPAPEVVIDTSTLSVAEPGATIVDHVEIEPLEVDTSALTLAEPGADLGPGVRPPPPPPPDTSHLSVDQP